jgi:hypothetical protein
LLKGRVRRTPLSCRSGVGVLGVGGLGVNVVCIFRIRGLSGRFVVIAIVIAGLGGRNLAIVLKVSGVIFLAIGGVRAGHLAVFHQIGPDEMLGKKMKVIREAKKKK